MMWVGLTTAEWSLEQNLNLNLLEEEKLLGGGRVQ